MKNKLLYSLLILSLSLVSCVPDQDILPYNNFILEDGARPWVIGHGGTKALFPENTMLAFAGAMEIGVDVLEMDIKLTKDNILVCHHDNEIDRMSNGSGIVHDFTYAELKAFNFGYTFEDLDGNRPYENDFVEICLLKDVFEAWPEMYFNVEIKDTGDVAKIAGEELLKLIESNYLKSQIIVASFSDESLDYFQELSGNTIPVSASKGEAKSFAISSITYTGIFHTPDAVAVQLPMEDSGFNLARKRVINSAHKHNMAIHYWTINDKEDMRLLIEKGADGIITDRPDILNELLDEMGY